VGKAVIASLSRVATTASLRIASTDPNWPAEGGSASLAETLLRDAACGHTIVPFWSAHQLTIALLTAERFGLNAVRDRFEVVVDDSLGGEIMRRVGERFGLRLRSLHARGNSKRFEDISAWLRSPEAFFIAVDGGSQYGSIPTGIIRLAMRLGSTLRPLAVRARPTIRLPGLVADIPLPGAALAIGVSPPLRLTRETSIRDAAEDLRRHLHTASQAAGELVGLRRSGSPSAPQSAPPLA
jgi:lysophospholipid acyltransferase (LPLAT)-like uncharacterized protein